MFKKQFSTIEISFGNAFEACQIDMASNHHSKAFNDFVIAKAGLRMASQEAGAVISLLPLLPVNPKRQD